MTMYGPKLRRQVAVRCAYATVSLLAMAWSGEIRAQTVLVSNAAALRQAIESAQPNQRIVLAPGDYSMSAVVDITHGGRQGSPVVLTALTAGTARIHSNTV